jgi:hypothetical protein
VMHSVTQNSALCEYLMTAMLGSTNRGQKNSLKSCVLLVVIVVISSLMNLDLNSLMFNKYLVILLPYI